MLWYLWNYTVIPRYKGHFVSRHLVLYKEVEGSLHVWSGVLHVAGSMHCNSHIVFHHIVYQQNKHAVATILLTS